MTVELSVVVLTWDNLPLSRRFVDSVRRHTELDHELIIVDNGSASDAADFARDAADKVVLNPSNLGFARGMNQGLELATGRYIAFCNNDTCLPEGWAAELVRTADGHPNAGIVVPALTAARNPVTVRSAPGDRVEVLAPFSPPPSAVLYLMPADVVRGVGGWGEEYEIASGEDLDLAFKVWVNDRDIVFDDRVLVEHAGKATASRLDDWEAVWATNRRLFLDKWSAEPDVARLPATDPDRFARNRATAAGVAGWMDRFFTLRDEARASGAAAPRGGVTRRLRRVAGRARRRLPTPGRPSR